MNWRLFLLFICFSGHIFAQEMGAPLDIPLFLSGNFGELRNQHFHSGLDFKTQGVTGFPVKAVKAGYITRISVGPYGFGRAVYINHPDGTTSIYGHLDHFAPKIESAVRDSQYVKESFSVDLTFSTRDFPVKQGEVIAYSGNTGGSGGPHLHFELRNTHTEEIIDPLPLFKDQLKDSYPPEIRGLLFVPQQGKGIVNGSSRTQTVNVIKNKSGVYALSTPVKAWGTIGIGIKAYDRMDSTTNTYGVDEIKLRVNGVDVFYSVMNSFFFNETRYINSFIDWEEWRTHRSFFMKSYIDPGNKLGIYRLDSSGLLSIEESKAYNCEYILSDAFGNSTIFNFIITGEKQSIPEEKKQGILFPYNRNNTFNGKSMTLNIPEGNLYTDVYLNPDTAQMKESPNKENSAKASTPIREKINFAPVYSFGKRIPLHGYCPLTLTITNDTYPDKRKYGVVSIDDNRKIWLGGVYESHRMKVSIRELGRFSVAIDTVPPVIVPANRAKWAINKRITFRISDNLSGIDFYQGTLDGKFVLFEYDAKTQSLFCNYDAKRMKKGKQKLILIVRDRVGNEARVSYEVVF